MDFSKIKAAAEGYRADMTKFLRELVAIPGESCGEEGHIRRIEAEMKKVGFDKVVIDPMGNVMGYMGAGKTLIGSDSHTPTGGGLGMLAFGAGGMDVAVAMGGGAYYITMPKMLKVNLTGKLLNIIKRLRIQRPITLTADPLKATVAVTDISIQTDGQI